jgi:hypothetical protein
MNSYELETEISAPIQKIGMSFYFEPGTAEIGKQSGLNIVEFYGMGRGGVLGDVETKDVAEAFWFFHDDAIEGFYGSAKVKIEPIAAAKAHLEAAYAHADERFGAIPEATVRQFADASRKAIDAVPAGQYALFDGYRQFPVPASPVHAAYLSTILLRELRGGVHIEATRQAGIAPNEACFVSSEFIFKLHGYGDADLPEDGAELRERMTKAEEMTDATMAGFLEVLSDAERDSMAAGVAAMSDALAQGAST